MDIDMTWRRHDFQMQQVLFIEDPGINHIELSSSDGSFKVI